MEDEKRPTKLRKLSHSTGVDEQVVPSSNDDDASHDNKQIRNGDTSAPNKEVDSDDRDQEVQEPSTIALGESRANSSLSKNQLKKIRRREEWEAGREYRKAKRKQKTAEKKERKKAEAREARRSSGGGQNSISEPQRNRHTQLPITILVDCSFDSLMVEKEMVSLGSQLTRSYSDNHRAPFQAHLVVSSWGGNLKQRFDTVLNKHYLNWRRVRFEEDEFSIVAERAKQWMSDEYGGKLDGVFHKYQSTTVEQMPVELNSENHSKEDAATDKKSASDDTLANGNSAQSEDPPAGKAQRSSEVSDAADLRSKGEVIYLTSDSPYTLTELKPYSTYIVGGLVDKNRYKGICYKTACEKGIKTAKLPIGEHMHMQSRFVLATNHVVEIMIRWLECGDWGEAFMKTTRVIANLN
ncbi:hypothetical protein DV736_g5167, partial [Chaetothyriales sp. CBS 134916]